MRRRRVFVCVSVVVNVFVLEGRGGCVYVWERGLCHRGCAKC